MPLWDFQKGTPPPLMAEFSHDFLQTSCSPGLALPDFKPFLAVYPLSALCMYIWGEGANKEGKHPRGRPSVCRSLISSGWSLREADKLKTFPSQHSPEGLSVPAPLLLLIILGCCKQQAALRHLRHLCPWRPVERAHPFQRGSVLLIYGAGAAAGVGPLQKNTRLCKIIKQPEGFLCVCATKGSSERNSFSVWGMKCYFRIWRLRVLLTMEWFVHIFHVIKRAAQYASLLA